MICCTRALPATACALVFAGVSAADLPVSFTDPVDGFAQFGNSAWVAFNPNKTGFFQVPGVGDLAPERGESYFVSRFNGGTFVGISRVFPFTIEPNITVFAGYDVGAFAGDLFGWPDGSPQFQCFADINGNGQFDNGEQITVTRQLERVDPVPPAPGVEPGVWEEWTDETFIGASTTTFAGDPVVGHQLGFLFRAAQPESMAPDMIYAWAVDDLFLRITRTILDNVDNNNDWDRIGSNGFWAGSGGANGLDPVTGDDTFGVTGTGSFVTIYQLFDGKTFEAGTSILAEYLVGDAANGQFGFFVPGTSQDQVTFSLFADTDGDGAFTPANGETVARRPAPFFPDPTRPTPADAFAVWNDYYVIDETTVTNGGDDVEGVPLGWVFRGRTPPPPGGGQEPYAWFVDSLRLVFNDIEEDDSIVLAAWDAVENTDDSGDDQDNNDNTNDSTPDIIAPGISAVLGGPGGGGQLQGGYEVRSGTKSTDLDFGNLSSPMALDVNNASVLRTSNDSQRRLDMDITNTSNFPLRLDRVHFDYARLFNAGPKLLSLFMRTLGGDLDLVGFPVVFVTENTFVLGSFPGDYADVDADLDVLADNILSPGETAAFRWQVDNADQTFSNLAIDNVAVTGKFSDCESDIAEPFDIDDAFDVAEVGNSVAAGDTWLAPLGVPFDVVDGTDVQAFLTNLGNCP
ncbi:MAG: hypothetical protein AAGI30_00185 [Planctomycetota bacterium]